MREVQTRATGRWFLVEVMMSQLETVVTGMFIIESAADNQNPRHLFG
jgi:hypothetical protein